MPSKSFASIPMDADGRPISCCPLCLEEKPVSSMCRLSKCSHASCKECMVTWIEKAEASGGTQPTCPFCRLELNEEDTVAVLGRNFQPATASNESVNGNDLEIDDLTLQWLQEQTRPCPHCGALIEKEEGCDLMECLCGYRFCYSCGSQGAQCSCTPSNHVFYDNLFRRNAGRDGQVLEESLLEEEIGLVDLHERITTRQENERRARVHEERQSQREREKWEQEEMCNATMNSTIWLFCSTKNGLRILYQQGQMERVRQKRSSDRWEQEREKEHSHEAFLSGGWLFRVEQARIDPVLKSFVRAEEVRRERMRRSAEVGEMHEGVSAVISNGSWLFRKRKCPETLELLTRLIEQERNSFQRSFERLFSSMFGCGRPGCQNCGDKVKDNAINIRLLFLEGDEKKRELAEINRDGL